MFSKVDYDDFNSQKGNEYKLNNDFSSSNKDDPYKKATSNQSGGPSL